VAGVGARRHVSLTSMHACMHACMHLSIRITPRKRTGESEGMIGEALSSEQLKDRREELVIVTKLGYLQGPLMQQAKQREAQNQAWPDVVKFHPQAWHCIHPGVS
jgi:hypothetical protein